MSQASLMVLLYWNLRHLTTLYVCFRGLVVIVTNLLKEGSNKALSKANSTLLSLIGKSHKQAAVTKCK